MSQGAIGGLVAGIGLSLVISSVISILDDGLNIKNGLLGLIEVRCQERNRFSDGRFVRVQRLARSSVLD